MRLTLLLIAAVAARAALGAELEAPKPPAAVAAGPALELPASAVLAAGAPEAGPAAAAALSAAAPAGGGVAGAAESGPDRRAADEAYGAAWAARAFDGFETPETGREPAAGGQSERALALSRLIAGAAGMIEAGHVDRVERADVLRLALRGLASGAGQSAHPAVGRLHRTLRRLAGRGIEPGLSVAGDPKSAVAGFLAETARRLAGARAPLALSEAARRMTAGLDRFTVVREPEKAAVVAQRNDGLVPAIGVRLKRAPDGPTVLSLTPGWPAEAAGLRPGDVLLTVNDEPASSGAVARALAGAPEEPVRLELRRPGEPRRLLFLVPGRKTRKPQVSAWLIGDAGYVKVARFAHGAAADAANAFYELKAKGAKRFVLDLRGNPGGFVEEETKLASLLLPDGALIQTAVTRHGPIQTRTRDVAGFIDAPLAVLVDEKSASASESVAGALQDHGRAVVVGRPTHGKGLMQRIHRLEDGSTVTITEGRWHTPAGRHFALGPGGVKLVPDIVVSEPGRGGRDPVLAKALEALGWTRPARAPAK